MTTGIAPAPYCSWMRRSISQPSTCGIITSSRTRSGFASSIAVEPLLGAAGLADGVALELEVHADELAHLLVVVDEQDERAGLRPAARAGAVEERLEVGAPVAPVAARRVERGHAALVGPLADRALGDAEEPGRLAEREPSRCRSSVAMPSRGNLAKASASYTTYGSRHDRFRGCNRQIRRRVVVRAPCRAAIPTASRTQAATSASSASRAAPPAAAAPPRSRARSRRGSRPRRAGSAWNAASSDEREVARPARRRRALLDGLARPALRVAVRVGELRERVRLADALPQLVRHDLDLLRAGARSGAVARARASRRRSPSSHSWRTSVVASSGHRPRMLPTVVQQRSGQSGSSSATMRSPSS